MGKVKKCTANEERFCQEYVKSGGNRIQAFDAGYPKSVNLKKDSKKKKAHNILQREQVKNRILEITKPVRDETECTLKDHLVALAHLRDLSVVFGNMDAAVRAERARGEASGHYIERTLNLHAGIPVARFPEKSPDAEKWLQNWAPPGRSQPMKNITKDVKRSSSKKP